MGEGKWEIQGASNGMNESWIKGTTQGLLWTLLCSVAWWQMAAPPPMSTGERREMLNRYDISLKPTQHSASTVLKFLKKKKFGNERIWNLLGNQNQALNFTLKKTENLGALPTGQHHPAPWWKVPCEPLSMGRCGHLEVPFEFWKSMLFKKSKTFQ